MSRIENSNREEFVMIKSRMIMLPFFSVVTCLIHQNNAAQAENAPLV